MQQSRRNHPGPRRRWAQDRSGAVAVYVALTAAVTFGVIGLAVDATRAMILRSEVQAAADAAALAAASQLDGRSDAISRADAALANLVANDQRFASAGGTPVTIASVRYLSGLPSSDDAPITDAFVTANPLEARFVEVTTAPFNHQTTFLRAVGATEGVDIARSAVGGCHQMICRAPPMMICNPAEAGGNTGAAFDIGEWQGRQVRLLYQDSEGQWAPGNFGYLSISANGANALADALASVDGADVCYGTLVETEPGLTNGARTALNTRFGIYENPQFGGSARNSPLYAPDVNVRYMPRDLLFTGADQRFGNGRWDCLSYWNANFASSGVVRPTACLADTTGFTRYDMYEFEIANGLVDEPGPGGVTGIPPLNAANALADRRIIYVAVVNCVEQGLNGREQDVPTVGFLRVFLTEPVTMPNAGGVEIIGEIVDIVQVGVDDTILHDIVQLYR